MSVWTGVPPSTLVSTDCQINQETHIRGQPGDETAWGYLRPPLLVYADANHVKGILTVLELVAWRDHRAEYLGDVDYRKVVAKLVWEHELQRVYSTHEPDWDQGRLARDTHCMTFRELATLAEASTRGLENWFTRDGDSLKKKTKYQITTKLYNLFRTVLNLEVRLAKKGGRVGNEFHQEGQSRIVWGACWPLRTSFVLSVMVHSSAASINLVWSGRRLRRRIWRANAKAL